MVFTCLESKDHFFDSNISIYLISSASTNGSSYQSHDQGENG